MLALPLSDIQGSSGSQRRGPALLARRRPDWRRHGRRLELGCMRPRVMRCRGVPRLRRWEFFKAAAAVHTVPTPQVAMHTCGLSALLRDRTYEQLLRGSPSRRWHRCSAALRSSAAAAEPKRAPSRTWGSDRPRVVAGLGVLVATRSSKSPPRFIGVVLVALGLPAYAYWRQTLT